MDDFASWLVAVTVLSVVALGLPMSLVAAEPTTVTTWTPLFVVKARMTGDRTVELSRHYRVKPSGWLLRHRTSLITALFPWNGTFDGELRSGMPGRQENDNVNFEGTDVQVELDRHTIDEFGAYRLSPAFGDPPRYVVWLPIASLRWRGCTMKDTVFIGFLCWTNEGWRLDRLFVLSVDTDGRSVASDGVTETTLGGRPVVRLAYCFAGPHEGQCWATRYQVVFENGFDGKVREIWSGKTSFDQIGAPRSSPDGLSHRCDISEVVEIRLVDKANTGASEIVTRTVRTERSFLKCDDFDVDARTVHENRVSDVIERVYRRVGERSVPWPQGAAARDRYGEPSPPIVFEARAEETR